MVAATLLNPDQVLLPPSGGIQRFNLYYSAPNYNSPLIECFLPQNLLSAAFDGVLVIDRISIVHIGTVGVVFEYIYLRVNPVSSGGTIAVYLDTWTTTTNPDTLSLGNLDVGVNAQTITTSISFLALMPSGYVNTDDCTISVVGHLELPRPAVPAAVSLEAYRWPLQRRS